ncbi:ribulose bisphosphate carboxylase small subunit [Corallococcus caeni]|uniref:Ribulose bisphosphate carboxylase small subunit n=1 Tax=Corallococcus caeni TaxID=3082388 RepID=A0ABQ6R5M8_9BACT|nr:ribulose bisphosphate carboxylase small subunit [Corallococcus sp. NO1]
MKVWPTEGKKKFETLSYLPPLTREQLLKEVEFLIRTNLIPCIEFELDYKDAFAHRENNRSPDYYDGRYWSMWRLPMFGCTDPVQVLKELDEAGLERPSAFARIIGFDNVRQVQVISFIAHRPEGY